MRLIILLFFLLYCIIGMAQTTLSGKVVNKHLDPLPAATIVIRQANDTTRQRFAVSDTAGNFLFSNIDKGAYQLTATRIGYKTSMLSFTVTDTSWQVLAPIILGDTATVLSAVSVKARTQPVEIQQGKIVFNIQNVATTSGLTAFDLLKRLPGITIDQNETITLRGSAGVNVLVNGKMTYLSGTQLTTFLKGISAEDINKIELNATPSAEYDAAGNAGIVNIILKKNLKKGYALDFRSGVSKGKFWMPNGNVSASLRTKAVNVYGSLDYKKPDNAWNSRSGNTIDINGQKTILERTNQSYVRTHYYTWHGGVEWQLSRKHQLSADYLGYKDDWKSTKTSGTENFDEVHNKTGSTASLYRNVEPYYYDALNIGYKYDIDSAGRNIRAEAHYVNYRNYSDATLTTSTYDAGGNLAGHNILLVNQPGFIKIRSVNTDANLRFGKYPVKTGLKYAEVENDNPYRFDSLKGGNYVPVDDMSNHFKYKERIAAAYISISRKMKTTSVDAGLRFEYTRADGYTVKQDVSNRWEYAQLFPSLAIAQKVGQADEIDISLSRRINRPSYSDLNPVRWYNDQFFYYSGNPGLVPELAWVFSTAYTFRHRYILTATYNVSNNYISRRLTMDGIAVKSQSANLGTMRRFDIIAALPFQLFSFWEMQVNPNISYMSYPIPQLNSEQTLSKWFATLAVQQRFNLPAGIKMDVSSQYYSAGLRGIYITRASFYTDIGIKRTFIPDRFDVQLTFSDVFNTNRYRGVSQSLLSNYYYNDKPDSRRIGITLHYHLGSDLLKGSGKRTEEQERL